MVKDSDLAFLAAAIGQGLAVGPPPEEIRGLARMMARQGMAGELAKAAFAEARAERPKSARLDGFVFLLGETLDELRLSGNGGSVNAQREVKVVLGMIGAEAEKGRLGPGFLMALARALMRAGLQPPIQLQEAMGAAVVPVGMGSDPQELLAGVNTQLRAMADECGGDPFVLYQELTGMVAAVPFDAQMALVAGLAEQASPVVLDALLGFVLNPAEALAQTAALACAEAAARHGRGALVLARLVRMRPWLRPPVQATADEAIARLRRRAPLPLEPAAGIVERCYATPCDGAGGQSLFALVKLGRKRCLLALLIKHGAGVADAWSAKGMGKVEADDLARRLIAESGAMVIGSEYLRRRMADALAQNAPATPPPFALVELFELLGWGVIPPDRVLPQELIEELLDGLPPEQTGADAVRWAQEQCLHWADEMDFAGAWFEAGEAVEALLRPIRGRAKREAAVLRQLLPHRRDFWLTQLAWTAAAMKEKAGKDPTWRSIALVGRALSEASDVAQDPLMQSIAIDTVRAFEGRG